MTAPEQASLSVLYLDFDGVLHSDDVGRDWHGKPYLRGQGSLFEYANRLIAALDPYPAHKIVLSTSWVRILGFGYARERLPQTLRERVIGATWHSRFEDDDRLHAWWIHTSTRYQQIAEDVKRRQPSHWFALDDDARGWPRQARAHLVECDSELGLGEPRARLLLETKLTNPPQRQIERERRRPS
jgi:hypothetical protein